MARLNPLSIIQRRQALRARSCSLNVIKNPAKLRCREVRIENQTRSCADKILVALLSHPCA